MLDIFGRAEEESVKLIAVTKGFNQFNVSDKFIRTCTKWRCHFCGNNKFSCPEPFLKIGDRFAGKCRMIFCSHLSTIPADG